MNHYIKYQIDNEICFHSSLKSQTYWNISPSINTIRLSLGYSINIWDIIYTMQIYAIYSVLDECHGKVRVFLSVGGPTDSHQMTDLWIDYEYHNSRI